MQSATTMFPPELPVWVDPERMSGTPCFAGTRCPVDALFNNLQSELNLDEFLDCFPGVTREQAVAVLEYSKQQFVIQDACCLPK